MSSNILTKYLGVLIFFLVGCATQQKITLQIEEPWDTSSDITAGEILPGRSPEQCHNALLNAYRQDSDRGYNQTISYTNTMLNKWSNHRYASGSTNLAGWAVLYTDVQEKAEFYSKSKRSWHRYIDSLIRASAYFELSAQLDYSTDGFWTSSSGAPLSVIHEGYENVRAVQLYIAAQRLLKVTYLRTQNERTLIEAIIILETIENDYPEWARRYGVIPDKQETLNAISVTRTRVEESKVIFGD